MVLTSDGTIHFSDKYALAKAVRCLEKVLPPPGAEIAYFCIGSDLSTGDCFDPLTGTLLKNMGFKNVIGSLDDTKVWLGANLLVRAVSVVSYRRKKDAAPQSASL